MSDTAIQLTDDDIERFILLCQEKAGITLDKKMATEKLHLLVRSMELIYRPVSKAEVAELTNENEAGNNGQENK